MRYLLLIFVMVISSASGVQAARKTGDESIFDIGTVVVAVSLSSQTMRVIVNGYPRYLWSVSTGAGSYATPKGVYGAEWLSKNHRSRKYNDAPMPYAIFFYQGYAVHGTNQLSHLGRPASHGCIRLDPQNAAVLFELARNIGLDRTTVVIGD